MTNWRDWSEDNAEYTRRLLEASLAGARSGRETFLNGRPLRPLLKESARNSVKPLAMGACVGGLTSYALDREKSVSRAVACSLLGAAIGFAIGFAWQIRGLALGVGSGAWEGVERVRDERWLEQNPIDYA
jgi:hypothetical protein